MSTRVATGIEGLDELIGRGLPEGYCYLVLGGPGAGKTTFGIQYLVKGIENQDENGVYVTLDEPPFSIINNARSNFGWDLSELESNLKLAIVDASPMEIEVPGNVFRINGKQGGTEFTLENVLGVIEQARNRTDPPAQRCVIDSISGLMFRYEDPFQQRIQLQKLIKGLTEMRMTTLLLGELSEESLDLQKFGPEAFLAQGVLVMHNIRIKNTITRVFQIRKLRGQAFSMEIVEYGIGKEGIEVYVGEKVFV